MNTLDEMYKIYSLPDFDLYERHKGMRRECVKYKLNKLYGVFAEVSKTDIVYNGTDGIIYSVGEDEYQ